MEKDFIPYEEALTLKELGFDEPCFAIFYNSEPEKVHFAHVNKSGKMLFQYNSLWKSPQSGVTAVPTYSQTLRWFREKYGFFVSPHTISYEDGPYLWFFEINSTMLPFGTDLGETDDYKTYEEAELACLKKLFETVKTKNK